MEMRESSAKSLSQFTLRWPMCASDRRLQDLGPGTIPSLDCCNWSCSDSLCRNKCHPCTHWSPVETATTPARLSVRTTQPSVFR